MPEIPGWITWITDERRNFKKGVLWPIHNDTIRTVDQELGTLPPPQLPDDLSPTEAEKQARRPPAQLTVLLLAYDPENVPHLPIPVVPYGHPLLLTHLRHLDRAIFRRLALENVEGKSWALKERTLRNVAGDKIPVLEDHGRGVSAPAATQIIDADLCVEQAWAMALRYLKPEPSEGAERGPRYTAMRVAGEIENDPPLSVPEAMARLERWGGDVAELQTRCWEGDLVKTHSYISQYLRDLGVLQKGEWPRDGSNRKTRWAPADWTPLDRRRRKPEPGV